MFDWNEFNRMMDEMFSPFGGNHGWDKKTYSSPDGSISYTFMTNKGFNKLNDKNDIELLKTKLEEAVELQDFEEAVKLRDKIKSLEQNYEEIKKLTKELNENIESQNFEKCIELRNQINELKK